MADLNVGSKLSECDTVPEIYAVYLIRRCILLVPLLFRYLFKELFGSLSWLGFSSFSRGNSVISFIGPIHIILIFSA